MSTSSSSRLPRAGLLAALLVIAVDHVALGVRGPWEILSRRSTNYSLDQGVANDRVAFREVRQASLESPRVFVVGTSRVNAGFEPRIASRYLTFLARPKLPGVTFGKVAHAAVDPFVVRSLAGEIIDSGASAVVLVLSEFDTHRPVQLEPLPDTSAASLAAFADLVDAAGPGFAFRNRSSLYRLGAAAALNGYRFREVLGHAGVYRAREFPLGDRLARPGFASTRRPPAFWGTAANPVARAEKRRIVELFPSEHRIGVGPEIDEIAQITRGAHVPVQMALVRRTVEVLQAAGVRVAVVEAPMHPAAADLYDTDLRNDFLTLASELERERGIEFVPIEAMESFAADDFYDLLHLRPAGTLKLTFAIARAVHRLLEPGGRARP